MSPIFTDFFSSELGAVKVLHFTVPTKDGVDIDIDIDKFMTAQKTVNLFCLMRHASSNNSYLN